MARNMGRRKKLRSSKIITAIVLVLILVIVLIGGRFYYDQISGTQTQSTTAKGTSVTKSGILFGPGKEVASTSKPAKISQTQADQAMIIAQCTKSLSDKVQIDKTQYEKGSILVGFKSTIQYSDAIAILTSYGISARNSADAQTNFSDHKILTVNVPQGQEFTDICTLKQNVGIRYTGLNELLALHQ